MAATRQRSTMNLVRKIQPLLASARLDADEFQAVFLEKYARIYEILFRLTGDRFEADDLTAETFWRLWEQPPARHDNLDGWLYRVASNLGYNQLRANRRRRQHEETAGKDAIQSQHTAVPHHEAELAAEREQVRQALSKLSQRDAQVIILRHSGLSYKEIAATLDLTPASIGTLLSRAEERFLKLYCQGEKDAPKT